MSTKTDRLASLFPELYAAWEPDSLLHHLLDAIGSEFQVADGAVKDLLKSHWVDHAQGPALDGLGALLGVTRRLKSDGNPEADDTFRTLVKSWVPAFIGGGTVEAIKGSVRAALGLPYNLEDFQTQMSGPAGSSDKLKALVQGLADLVEIVEFAPKSERVSGQVTPTSKGSSLLLEVDFPGLDSDIARIEWTFPTGNGRRLRIERQDVGGRVGIRSADEFCLPCGATLVLTREGDSGFTAWLLTASQGRQDISKLFVNLDGTSPSRLPQIPPGLSKWLFTARGAEFDRSKFDDFEAFNGAGFNVKLHWVGSQPLDFDVIVPYFLGPAVAAIVSKSGYDGRFNVFQGLSYESLQAVVDRNRAAGVRGSVQYSLRLPSESKDRVPFEDHAMREAFRGFLGHRQTEFQDVEESLFVGALDTAVEVHDSSERFVLGGVFDISRFDTGFGFHST